MTLNGVKVATLLALATSFVFWVACGSGNDAIEERWARLGLAEPEIVFLGDFSEEERAAIRREVKGLQVFYAERFGVATSEFTLYISTEFEALNDAYREWLHPVRSRRHRGMESNAGPRHRDMGDFATDFLRRPRTQVQDQSEGSRLCPVWWASLRHPDPTLGF